MVKRMLLSVGGERVNDTLRIRRVGTETFYDTTALIRSSVCGRTEVVELLIGAKVDVNKCNQVGF
jgi:tRNA 2-selenouridine synthase SelU